MAQTYSSGATLPPNGEGAPSPITCPVRCPLFPVIPRFVLQWGAYDDRGFHLPYPPASLARVACVATRGVPPPSSYLSGAPPPSISCRFCARSTRCCLGGDLSSPSWLGGTPPSLSCSPCSGSARYCSGGAHHPPSPVCTLEEPAARLGCPPLSYGRVWDTRAAVWGIPTLPHTLDTRWGSPLPGRGVPLYPLAARVKRKMLCAPPHPSYIYWIHTGGVRGLVRVSPSIPWPRVGSARCWVGATPPPPPWWIHMSSVRCRSGDPCSSASSSGWPHVRSVSCPFRFPVPIYLLSDPPASEVSLRLSLLLWGYAEAGLPAVSSGTSKPYS